MRNLKRLPALFVVGLALCAIVINAAPPTKPAPTLQWTCNGATNPVTDNCLEGEQGVITGDGYNHIVVVVVLDPDGNEYYNSKHTTAGGSLECFQVPIPAGKWTARTIKGKSVLAQVQFDIDPVI